MSLHRVFLTDYRTQLARERDRVSHDLRITRWNPIDLVTEEIIQRVDLELNKQIVVRIVKLLVY